MAGKDRYTRRAGAAASGWKARFPGARSDLPRRVWRWGRDEIQRARQL